jgi:hypothetical protein
MKLSMIGKKEAPTENGTSTVYRINAPKFVTQARASIIAKNVAAVEQE